MKKNIVMLALLVIPFAVQAQTRFHDVEANDAKGPVSAITIYVMGVAQKLNFSRNGKLVDFKNPVYDANGYIRYCEMEYQGVMARATWEWGNGKLKKTITEIPNLTTTISTYVYNEKGEVVKNIVNTNGVDMTAEYYDYRYDNHGNWVSRKVIMMGQVMENIRTIEYFY